MPITEEERTAIHAEFRKYLRTQENKKGQMLNNIMTAAEKYAPGFIKKVRPEFTSLYDDDCTLQFLMGFEKLLEKKNSWKNERFGLLLPSVLVSYAKFRAIKEGKDFSRIRPQEIPDPDIELDISDEEIDDLREGEERDSVSKRFERSRKARKKCIELYGCKCFVCGFDFEAVYGELGKDYIEVHHVWPVSKRRSEYKVNVASDLRPLCSNCHSMVHRKRENVLDVENLRSLLKRNE